MFSLVRFLVDWLHVISIKNVLQLWQCLLSVERDSVRNFTFEGTQPNWTKDYQTIDWKDRETENGLRKPTIPTDASTCTLHNYRVMLDDYHVD